MKLFIVVNKYDITQGASIEETLEFEVKDVKEMLAAVKSADTLYQVIKVRFN